MQSIGRPCQASVAAYISNQVDWLISNFKFSFVANSLSLSRSLLSPSSAPHPASQIRGAVMPVSKWGVKCEQSDLDTDPCSCFGGTARRVGVFESIRNQFRKQTIANSTRNNSTSAGVPNYVVTVDTGGYFFGSGLFFPAFNGNVSAAMRQASQYDAMGMSFIDFSGFKPFPGGHLFVDYAYVAAVAHASVAIQQAFMHYKLINSSG